MQGGTTRCCCGHSAATPRSCQALRGENLPCWVKTFPVGLKPSLCATIPPGSHPDTPQELPASLLTLRNGVPSVLHDGTPTFSATGNRIQSPRR